MLRPIVVRDGSGAAHTNHATEMPNASPTQRTQHEKQAQAFEEGLAALAKQALQNDPEAAAQLKR